MNNKPSSVGDFEDDKNKKLRITDPSGNESSFATASYVNCEICKNGCDYYGKGFGICWGHVERIGEPGSLFLYDKIQHSCAGHKKMGGPDGYYVSEETDKDGPIERMLGESSNDPLDIGDKGKTNEDPRYTNEP